MTTLSQLQDFVKNAIHKYPQLENQFAEYYQLCIDEIESGESMYNEMSLCENSINEAIVEHLKTYN
jgi:hypothetical protein